MGQSLVQQYTHIVFSTKHQQPLILEHVEGELYAYIGGICKNLECNPVRIGGHHNHVHILCNLSKKIALADLLEKVKSNSSRFAKGLDKRMKNFYWQNGYAAFSASPVDVHKVVKYIANQHKHHRLKTYQEEVLAFLKRYNIPYDERYIWD